MQKKEKKIQKQVIFFQKLPISNIGLEDFIQKYFWKFNQRNIFFFCNIQHYVYFLDLNLIKKNNDYKIKFFNDSRVFQIFSQIFLNEKITQIRCIDFLKLFFLYMNKRKKIPKMYFLLTNEKISNYNILKKKLKAEFPRLNPFVFGQTLNYKEVKRRNFKKNKKIIAQINRFKPDILFVGWGVPFGHKWILKNHPFLKAKCIIEIGGAVDFFTGLNKESPYFFTKIGLEWFWRFFHNPLKLWRRYFFHNPRIFLYFAQEVFFRFFTFKNK